MSLSSQEACACTSPRSPRGRQAPSSRASQSRTISPAVVLPRPNCLLRRETPTSRGDRPSSGSWCGDPHRRIVAAVEPIPIWSSTRFVAVLSEKTIIRWMASRSGKSRRPRRAREVPEPGTLSSSRSVRVRSRPTSGLGLPVRLDHDRELDQAGRRHRLVGPKVNVSPVLRFLTTTATCPWCAWISGRSRASNRSAPRARPGQSGGPAKGDGRGRSVHRGASAWGGCWGRDAAVS